MRRYTVRISPHAERDLESIEDYLFEHDSAERAHYVASKIEETIAGLSEAPHRGVVPRELKHTGETEIREVFFKPYRISYMVIAKRVEVIFVADGRRNLAALFQERLVRP